MRMLQEIATKDEAELRRMLRESMQMAHVQMERKGRVTPSEHGNRRQRRAAAARERRLERA